MLCLGCWSASQQQWKLLCWPQAKAALVVFWILVCWSTRMYHARRPAKPSPHQYKPVQTSLDQHGEHDSLFFCMQFANANANWAGIMYFASLASFWNIYLTKLMPTFLVSFSTRFTLVPVLRWCLGGILLRMFLKHKGQFGEHFPCLECQHLNAL